MPEKIYTIIATFNGENWIERCLACLMESSVKTDIIVVDNASRDNTKNIVREKFSDVKLIECPKNLGFGKANNIGINKVLKNNPDFIFLLNQDTELDPNALREMLEAQRITGAGVVSPVHLNIDGSSVDRLFLDYTASNKQILSDLFLQKPRDFYELPYVNAAAWLISLKCLEKVGGFDPLFHHYGEDEDYCYRMKYFGEKLCVATKAIVKHCHIKSDQEDKFFWEIFKTRLRELKVEIINIDYSFIRTSVDELYDLALKIARDIIRPHRYKYMLADILVFPCIVALLPNIVRSRMISKKGKFQFLEK
jgi:GT2 family glycosyltransferase